MNTIAGFRLCKLDNEELVKRVDKYIDNIYISGRIPDRHIPAKPNEDFDLLSGELNIRFKENNKKLTDIKDLVETCLSADPKDEALLQIIKILEEK